MHHVMRIQIFIVSAPVEKDAPLGLKKYGFLTIPEIMILVTLTV